jgi:aryl-alcohol dehydrogenase-like predicted oxidoreductase
MSLTTTAIPSSPTAGAAGADSIYRPISLGFWHNFGDDKPWRPSGRVMRRAFDLGVTHFDLANNYGPPFGAAESNAGRSCREDFGPYRNELVISSKAGWDMWPGRTATSARASTSRPVSTSPCDVWGWTTSTSSTTTASTRHAAGGDHGRAGRAVRAGKALYVGRLLLLARRTPRGPPTYSRVGTPLLIHQPSYSMFNRWIEPELLDVLEREGVGCIAFTRSPRACSPTAISRGCLRTRGRAGQVPRSHLDRGEPGRDQGAQRDRRRSRPDPRAVGTGLGVARLPGHLDPDRGQ